MPRQFSRGRSTLPGQPLQQNKAYLANWVCRWGWNVPFQLLALVYAARGSVGTPSMRAQRFPARCLGVGPAAGFNCPDWKMRKLDGSGEVLAACGGIGLVKDAGFSLPMLLPMLLSTLRRRR